MGTTEQKEFPWLLILLPGFMAVALIVAGYFGYQASLLNKIDPNQTACTQEAKVCPDGTSVGRTGPNCEFAACPDATAGWQTYSDTNHGFEFRYPESLGSTFATWNQSPIVIFSAEGSKNISKGCYVSNQMESIPTNSQVTINGMNLCLTQTSGVGAGQLYREYDYTGTRGDGFYFTLHYVVHVPNGCGAYQGTSNYQGCLDAVAAYDTTVLKLIEQSVATSKFSQ